MENFDIKNFLILWGVLGICLGVSFWVSVKIVDRENRQNTIVSSLIFGIILQALLFIPLAGIVVAVMVLAFLYRNLDLDLGEIAVATFIVVILYLLAFYLVKWIFTLF